MLPATEASRSHTTNGTTSAGQSNLQNKKKKKGYVRIRVSVYTSREGYVRIRVSVYDLCSKRYWVNLSVMITVTEGKGEKEIGYSCEGMSISLHHLHMNMIPGRGNIVIGAKTLLSSMQK